MALTPQEEQYARDWRRQSRQVPKQCPGCGDPPASGAVAEVILPGMRLVAFACPHCGFVSLFDAATVYRNFQPGAYRRADSNDFVSVLAPCPRHAGGRRG